MSKRPEQSGGQQPPEETIEARIQRLEEEIPVVRKRANELLDRARLVSLDLDNEFYEGGVSGSIYMQAEQLYDYADTLQAFLDQLVRLAERRNRPRFYYLGKIATKLFGNHSAEVQLDSEPDFDVEASEFPPTASLPAS